VQSIEEHGEVQLLVFGLLAQRAMLRVPALSPEHEPVDGVRVPGGRGEDGRPVVQGFHSLPILSGQLSVIGCQFRNRQPLTVNRQQFWV